MENLRYFVGGLFVLAGIIFIVKLIRESVQSIRRKKEQDPYDALKDYINEKRAVIEDNHAEYRGSTYASVIFSFAMLDGTVKYRASVLQLKPNGGILEDKLKGIDGPVFEEISQAEEAIRLHFKKLKSRIAKDIILYPHKQDILRPSALHSPALIGLLSLLVIPQNLFNVLASVMVVGLLILLASGIVLVRRLLASKSKLDRLVAEAEQKKLMYNDPVIESANKPNDADAKAFNLRDRSLEYDILGVEYADGEKRYDVIVYDRQRPLWQKDATWVSLSFAEMEFRDLKENGPYSAYLDFSSTNLPPEDRKTALYATFEHAQAAANRYLRRRKPSVEIGRSVVSSSIDDNSNALL